MKRMFDKEEIVEIAKEEGGSITVDSELSSTSENPVQNKVITEALNGTKLYKHYLQGQVSISTATVYIRGLLITNKSDAYTTQTLGSFLQESAGVYATLLVSAYQINSGSISYIITDFEIVPVFSGTNCYIQWTEIKYENSSFVHSKKNSMISNFIDNVVEL